MTNQQCKETINALAEAGAIMFAPNNIWKAAELTLFGLEKRGYTITRAEPAAPVADDAVGVLSVILARLFPLDGDWRQYGVRIAELLADNGYTLRLEKLTDEKLLEAVWLLWKGFGRDSYKPERAEAFEAFNQLKSAISELQARRDADKKCDGEV